MISWTLPPPSTVPRAPMPPPPSVASSRMALFERVWPPEKLMVLVIGRMGQPAGANGTTALAGGRVTVTLTEPALAAAGTPQAGPTANVRSVPEARAGVFVL